MTSISLRPVDRLADHLRRHRLGYWDAAVLGGTAAFLVCGALISLLLLR